MNKAAWYLSQAQLSVASLCIFLGLRLADVGCLLMRASNWLTRRVRARMARGL